jgi:predicted MFS family arabinose efflux permease
MTRTHAAGSHARHARFTDSKSVRSLRNPNFRLFLAGQGVSQTGLWMQQTAELWLILQLTGRGSALGLHAVLRFGPVLLFGAYAGLFSDRFDRRRVLIGTQSVLALTAATVAVTSWIAEPSLVLIYSAVMVQGLVNAVDNPLRRGFVRDLVSDEDLTNGVSLNSSVMTLARTIGPALGGVVLATLGAVPCFAINAISYTAVLATLFRLDSTALRHSEPVARAAGQVREGLRYAWQRREIRTALLMITVAGAFVWNWATILPVYAETALAGGASLYGLLLSMLSIGAFLGGLASTRLVRIHRRHLVITSAMVAGALLATALAGPLPVVIIALMSLGAASTALAIGCQSRVQLATDDAISGRVLALYSVGFVGSKPLGGVIAGWVIDAAGPRAAFGVNTAVIAAMTLALALASWRAAAVASHR